MVARENDHILGVIPVDEAYILIDSICGTRIPVCACSLLIRRQYMDTAVYPVKVPGLTVADILIEYQRLVLSKYTNGIYTRIDAV